MVEPWPRALKPDLCVIGAGSGGLTVAAGAAQLGAQTVLIEKATMGGECLNSGCVPSKALLAAAEAVYAAGHGRGLAAALAAPRERAQLEWAKVHGAVQDVIAALAPNDSAARFEGLGVRVIHGAARFVARDAVAVGDARIEARRFVVATGSTAIVPAIPGLDGVPYFTNATIFANRQRPAHLLVLGGGAVGLELAQAHARLGCRVTVIEARKILASHDAELVDVLRRRLLSEGIVLHEQAQVRGVSGGAGDISLTAEIAGQTQRIVGSHLLIAAGRRAAIDGLGLEEAGIEASSRGILVDARLRTSNKRVFAIGDVAGGPQSTHLATYQAGIVLRNALFRLPAKADDPAVPEVLYTAPELASVGLSAEQAAARFGQIRILRWPFAENDRARTEGDIDGLIKVVATGRGRVLGAAIVGRAAGELILPWIFAVKGQLSLRQMASVIAPYPTRGEASKRLAGSFYARRLFSPATRRLVRFLSWFG